MNHWIELIYPVISISVFHALIPSHWLPVIALGKKYKWDMKKVMGVTFLIGSAHVGSTIITGFLVALGSRFLSNSLGSYFIWVTPALLVALGFWFLYRHYTHHHFHVEPKPEKTTKQMIIALSIAMFFSPCLEIEGFYLLAGPEGWNMVGLISIIYAAITILGMLLWVALTYAGLKKFNSHAWEHYSGIITGLILVLSGILQFIIE